MASLTPSFLVNNYSLDSYNVSSESDSSLEEDTEMSELVRSGSNVYGEGATTSANSSSTSSALLSSELVDK